MESFYITQIDKMLLLHFIPSSIRTFIPSTECYVNNLTFDIFTFGNFQFKKSNFDMATLYIPIFVWRKMILLHFGASFLKGFPGANLAITSYNASVIKIYNTTR
jgi:hypothetical protein